MHVDDIPALGWKLEAGECVRRMDEAGIDKGVIMTIVDAPEVNPNALELIAEACAAYPGRLEAFARIHPRYGDEAVALLERAIAEYGFKGLKLHPVTTIAHPAGADSLRLIRKAAEHSAPTLFHCGDEPLTTPLAIARAAEACLEATIILGHMGGYFHVDEAIEIAERVPNSCSRHRPCPTQPRSARRWTRSGRSASRTRGRATARSGRPHGRGRLAACERSPAPAPGGRLRAGPASGRSC